MSAIEEFEEAREDLCALLIEVLASVLGEEAMPSEGEELPPGRLMVASLEIHDNVEDSYTMVEVAVGELMSRVLAARMMSVPSPSPDDVMDAVGELGNIAGGNVKSLLRHSCRLSLPSVEVVDGPRPERPGVVRVGATVLGQLVELSVRAADETDGAFWPGALAYTAGSDHSAESHP